MIEKIIIISLFTFGYCCTFWPGMILERIGDWLELHLPEWLNKPLWQCYICACPWLGTILYWFVFPYCKKFIEYNGNVFEWILCIIPAMGLNAVINELTNKKEYDNTQI